MDRQKERLLSNLAQFKSDVDSVVQRLQQKVEEGETLVNVAKKSAEESDSKKFRKNYESAKRSLNDFTDLLDKIAGVLDDEAVSSEEGATAPSAPTLTKNSSSGSLAAPKSDLAEVETGSMSCSHVPQDTPPARTVAKSSSVTLTSDTEPGRYLPLAQHEDDRPKATEMKSGTPTSTATTPLAPSVARESPSSKISVTPPYSSYHALFKSPNAQLEDLLDMLDEPPKSVPSCNAELETRLPSVPSDEKSEKGSVAMSWPVNKTSGFSEAKDEQFQSSLTFLPGPSSLPNIVKRLICAKDDLFLNFDRNRGFVFMFSIIESPILFCVHPILDDLKNLDKLCRDMKSFYGSHSAALDKVSRDFEVSVGEIAVAPKDDSFCRVVVKEISCAQDEEFPLCHVFYFDFGDSEFLPLPSLLPVIEEFATLPPFCIKCRLVVPDQVLLPVVNNAWTRLDVEKMGEACPTDRCYRGFPSWDCVDLDPTKEEILQMRATTIDYFALDQIFVSAGFARYESETGSTAPIVMGEIVSESRVEISEPEESKAQESATSIVGNAMERDWMSPTNIYQERSPMKSKEVCPHWRRGNTCLKMDCPLLHREPTVDDKREQMEANLIDEGYNEPIALLCEEWYVCEVTSYRNPGHFYVRFPFGVQSLSSFDKSVSGSDVFALLTEEGNDSDLKIRMTKFYKRNSRTYRLDVSDLRRGEMVAARVADFYYRARVLRVDDEKDALKILFLDYGSTQTISLDPWENVLSLDKRFMHQQFQATECHLASVLPSDDGKWSLEAVRFFVETVRAKKLVMHVKYLLPEGTPCIELWDTSKEDRSEDLLINDMMVKNCYAKAHTNCSDQQVLSCSSSSQSFARVIS